MPERFLEVGPCHVALEGDDLVLAKPESLWQLEVDDDRLVFPLDFAD